MPFVGLDLWFDPLLVRRNFSRSYHGKFQRIFRGGEILFELIWGEKERRSGGIEAVVGLIGWEIRNIGGDSKESFDRVSVFASIETTHGDDTAIVGEDFSSVDDLD